MDNIIPIPESSLFVVERRHEYSSLVAWQFGQLFDNPSPSIRIVDVDAILKIFENHLLLQLISNNAIRSSHTLA